MLQPIASFTRPSNTTAYTAGDVVSTTAGAVMTFASDAEGLVRAAVLIDSAAESTKPEFDLFLFTVAPNAVADNSAFAPTDGEMLNCIGVVSFLAADFKAASGNGMTQGVMSDMSYLAAGGNLYGVLVARNAYTPVSAEVFAVRLSIIQES